MQGQIIKALAGFYYVESDGQVYQTRARGNFRKKVIHPMLETGSIFLQRKIQKAISSRFMNGKTVWSVRLLSILTKLW